MKVMLEDNQLKQFFKSFDVTKFDQYRDWIVARLIFDTGSQIGELLDIVPSELCALLSPADQRSDDSSRGLMDT